MENEFFDVFVIICRMGCTCCSNENHIRGFYLTREEAQARIDRFKKGIDNLVASQYAKFGSYRIDNYQAEKISNNRIIVQYRVFSLESITTINLEDGSIFHGFEDDEILNEEYF